jgi:hypothetical protein
MDRWYGDRGRREKATLPLTPSTAAGAALPVQSARWRRWPWIERRARSCARRRHIDRLINEAKTHASPR